MTVASMQQSVQRPLGIAAREQAIALKGLASGACSGADSRRKLPA
ncbi:MAG: hypothetical protein K0R44_581 [Thermomicrobiales bacterium]|nr:hypothetical protein [Thermomicrobiales bacterium]MDF3015356.1 hypothetical protein [Thermomicrobiales bacterium]